MSLPRVVAPSISRCISLAATVALPLVLTSCCRTFSDDSGSGNSSATSSSASLPPVSLDDLPAAIKDARCARDDAAKLDVLTEASLTTLRAPIAPKQTRRFGWTCQSKPIVLVALEYADEEAAKRALLHFAHDFVLPADLKAALARPVGDVARRGAVVSVAAGEMYEGIALALRDDHAFVAAIPGFPPEGRGGVGSALPFVSRPGAFTAARQARDNDYGCPEKVPATVHACADLLLYERGGEGPRPGRAPEAYLGTCVVKPYPTPTSPGVVEEPCYLLWSPLGVDVGTVKSLGVTLEGVSLDKLRTVGAAALPADKALALRDAILEHGPGTQPEWVDGAHRAIVADGKETISIRADANNLVAVRATNDRTKEALLVAGFARPTSFPDR